MCINSQQGNNNAQFVEWHSLKYRRNCSLQHFSFYQNKINRIYQNYGQHNCFQWFKFFIYIEIIRFDTNFLQGDRNRADCIALYETQVKKNFLISNTGGCSLTLHFCKAHHIHTYFDLLGMYCYECTVIQKERICIRGRIICYNTSLWHVA